MTKTIHAIMAEALTDAEYKWWRENTTAEDIMRTTEKGSSKPSRILENGFKVGGGAPHDYWYKIYWPLMHSDN